MMLISNLKATSIPIKITGQKFVTLKASSSMLSQSLFKKTAHPLFFIKVSLVVTKKHMSKGQNCLVNTVRCVNDNMFRGGVK